MNRHILILIFVGFALYANALGNAFVWDDEEMIVNNPQVHSLSFLPQLLSGSTFYSGGAGNLSGLYYKPAMTIAYAFLYTAFGPNPLPFHLFQISLHVANATTLFLLLKRMLGREILAFALSLLFLVHPINTEAVVYIADLQDVMNFFFGLLALYLNQPFLLLFSLLSKETGAVWVGIVLLHSILFLRSGLKRVLIHSGIAVAISALLRFGVAGIYFQKHGLAGISTLPFAERMVNVPAIIFHYVKTLLWPKDLAINQQWVVQSVDPWQMAAVVLFLISLIVFTRNRLRLFFLLWFVASLSLHLQFFPLDLTVSDRWFYLPFAGLLGFVGAVVCRIRVKTPRLAIFGCIALSTLLAARTLIRTFDWKNGLTLYSRDILISRDAFDLENNLGVELFRAGKSDQARVHFEKSVELAPDWWPNWNNVGVMQERAGRYEDARASYQKAIDNGRYYLAYENMAKLLYYRFDRAEGVSFARTSLQYFPDNPTLRVIAGQ